MMSLGIRHYSIVTVLTCLIVTIGLLTIGLLAIDDDSGTLLWDKSDILWIGFIFFASSLSFVYVVELLFLLL